MNRASQCAGIVVCKIYLYLQLVTQILNVTPQDRSGVEKCATTGKEWTHPRPETEPT